jgi:hypothetical protein
MIRSHISFGVGGILTCALENPSATSFAMDTSRKITHPFYLFGWPSIFRLDAYDGERSGMPSRCFFSIDG